MKKNRRFYNISDFEPYNYPKSPYTDYVFSNPFLNQMPLKYQYQLAKCDLNNEN